jgi:uncharacterized protein (TIGR04255 family)
MARSEVYRNPTVKRVIFQIRFPNLFYMESKIGDYQMRVMERFPESSLAYQRNILIADVGPDVSIGEIPRPTDDAQVSKIWRFRSPDAVELNIHTNSLDISSTVHKTYNNQQVGPRFRDVIELAVSTLIELTSIPVLSRIGLRYVDECPVPERTNEAYGNWYSTAFPLGRFPISDALEMLFIGRVRRGKHYLTYREQFWYKDGKPRLTLDFDGYAENVRATDYLTIADELHGVISEEYEERTIKEPVRQYMRGEVENDTRQ